MSEIIREIKDGKLSVNVPDGKYLITIESVPKRRSLRALRFYWGAIVSLIAEHTGYTKEEVHELFKAKFNRKEIPDFETGEMIVFGGSTREMTTQEFSEFTAKAEDVARYLEIRIPSIEEYWEGLTK